MGFAVIIWCLIAHAPFISQKWLVGFKRIELRRKRNRTAQSHNDQPRWERSCTKTVMNRLFSRADLNFHYFFCRLIIVNCRNFLSNSKFYVNFSTVKLLSRWLVGMQMEIILITIKFFSSITRKLDLNTFYGNYEWDTSTSSSCPCPSSLPKDISTLEMFVLDSFLHVTRILLFNPKTIYRHSPINLQIF